MNGCVNKELGEMLHDFELGLLSDEDKHRFEMHLYECDFCLTQVKDFMDAARILRHDADVKTLIDKFADEGKDKKTSSTFLKFLAAAVIVILIALPIYYFSSDRGAPQVTQTLELLPSRAGGSDVIYLEKGGEVGISFYVADSIAGSLNLVILKVGGDTILSLNDVTDIDDHGMGTITLPVADFSEGHYMLQVSPPDTAAVPARVYMFRVK